MQNTRLQLLLERAPITDEDRHNISRIFAILSPERQSQLISDWDGYITRFVAIRNQLQEEEARRFLSGLQAIDVLLDEAMLRESEREYQKNENKKQIRAELESTLAYDQMQRLRRTKDLLKTKA
jgi:HD-like signal output (HDOD) protein